MPSNSAMRVQQIIAETNRRKRVWKLMNAASLRALTAVQAYARKHGANHMEWFDGGLRSGEIYVSYRAVPNGDLKSLSVRRNGRLSLPEYTDETYQNYPNLGNNDVAPFEDAAVEKMMAILQRYLKDKHAQRRTGKRPGR